MTDKLIALQNYGPFSVNLALNAHATFYEDAEQYYHGLRELNPNEVGDIDYNKPLWELQLYPEHAILFYLAISHDLDALIQWGIDIMKESMDI